MSVLAVAREERDSDARPDLHRLILDGDRLLQRLEDRLRDLARPDLVGTRQEQRELVPAEPSERVAPPDRAGEPGGDLPEQLVARGVTEGVVDLFEVIEVHEQEGEGCVLTHRGRDGDLEAVEEQRTIRELRQRVAEGLLAQRTLRLALLGDLRRARHDLADLADDVDERHDVDLPPARAAVVVPDPHDDGPLRLSGASCDRTGHLGRRDASAVGRYALETGRWMKQHVFEPVSDRGTIRVEHAARAGLNDDAARERVVRRADLLVARTHGNRPPRPDVSVPTDRVTGCQRGSGAPCVFSGDGRPLARYTKWTSSSPSRSAFVMVMPGAPRSRSRA